jgi:hypothetical protein
MVKRQEIILQILQKHQEELFCSPRSKAMIAIAIAMIAIVVVIVPLF